MQLLIALLAALANWHVTDSIGIRGQTPGHMIMPYGVSAAPNGDLVVTDTGNSRLQGAAAGRSPPSHATVSFAGLCCFLNEFELYTRSTSSSSTVLLAVCGWSRIRRVFDCTQCSHPLYSIVHSVFRSRAVQEESQSNRWGSSQANGGGRGWKWHRRVRCRYIQPQVACPRLFIWLVS